MGLLLIVVNISFTSADAPHSTQQRGGWERGLSVCMYVGVHVHMHVFIYACLYVCLCVCVYVCMHVCMYVCHGVDGCRLTDKSNHTHRLTGDVLPVVRELRRVFRRQFADCITVSLALVHNALHLDLDRVVPIPTEDSVLELLGMHLFLLLVALEYEVPKGFLELGGVSFRQFADKVLDVLGILYALILLLHRVVSVQLGDSGQKQINMLGQT